MAQQQIVTLVDDLDGTESDDITTVQFGLDGVTYEIDLTDDNANRLRGALEDFVTNARRVGGRLQRGKKPTASNAGDAGLVRIWAREQGYDVSERGRVAEHIMEAYRAAQNAETEAPVRARRRPNTNRVRPATPEFAGAGKASVKKSAPRKTAAKS